MVTVLQAIAALRNVDFRSRVFFARRYTHPYHSSSDTGRRDTANSDEILYSSIDRVLGMGIASNDRPDRPNITILTSVPEQHGFTAAELIQAIENCEPTSRIYYMQTHVATQSAVCFADVAERWREYIERPASSFADVHLFEAVLSVAFGQLPFWDEGGPSTIRSVELIGRTRLMHL
jgi:hypothetical protein